MRIMIEFYRTRPQDDAHALVARERAEAGDLEEALAIAYRLLQSLSMPQLPDAVTVTDDSGATLHSGPLASLRAWHGDPPS